jgi:hypothetical protein
VLGGIANGLRNPRRRAALTLSRVEEHFVREGLGPSDIEVFLNTVERDLRTLGINVRPTPRYEEHLGVDEPALALGQAEHANAARRAFRQVQVNRSKRKAARWARRVEVAAFAVLTARIVGSAVASLAGSIQLPWCRPQAPAHRSTRVALSDELPPEGSDGELPESRGPTP